MCDWDDLEDLMDLFRETCLRSLQRGEAAPADPFCLFMFYRISPQEKHLLVKNFAE